MARILQKAVFYYEQTNEGKALKQIGGFPKSLSDVIEEALLQYQNKEEEEFGFGFGTTNFHHVFYVIVQTSETPVLIVAKLDSFYEFNPRDLLVSLIMFAQEQFREQEVISTIMTPPLFESAVELQDQPVCAFLEAMIKKNALILQSLNQVEVVVNYFTEHDHVPLLHVSGIGLSYNSPFLATAFEWVDTSLGIINPNKRCSEYITTITSLNKLIEAQPSITKLALINLSQALLLLHLGKKTEFSRLGEDRIELSLNVIKKQATDHLIPTLIAILQEFLEKALIEGKKIPYYFGQTIVELAVKGQMQEEIRVINAEYAGVLQKDLGTDLKQLYFEAIIDNSLLISVKDTLSALQTTWELIHDSSELREIYMKKLDEALDLLPESPELYQNLVGLFLTIGNYKQAIEAKIKGFEYEVMKHGLNLDDVIDLIQWGMRLDVTDTSLKQQIMRYGLQKFFDKQFEVTTLINIHAHLLELARESLSRDLLVYFLQETVNQASTRMVQDQFLVFKYLDDYLSNEEDNLYYNLILDIRLRTFKVAIMTNNIPEAMRLGISLLNGINLDDENAEETLRSLLENMMEFTLLYAQHELTMELIKRAEGIIREQGFKIIVVSVIHLAIKQIIQNYGIESVYAPYFTTLIKELIQKPEVKESPYLYKDLLEIGLQINYADHRPQAYYEFFTLLQTYKLQEGTEQIIDFLIKGIFNLIEINGDKQAKEIIKEVSEGILEAEQLQGFYRKLLDLPDEVVQQLLSPTEVAQIRRELARLQSRVLDNEEGLEHYVKGVRELQERKEYELVRDMAIEGIKYAIERNAKEKLPLFLQPLKESFQVNFNTYSKIKSDAIYFDLIKDLRELTQLLYKEPEVKIIIQIILELASIESIIAKKDSNPKITVLHCYRGISTLKEFLVTATTLGISVNEDIQVQVWNEIKALYVIIVEKQRYNRNVLPRLLAQFIVVTKMFNALQLYYSEFALSQQILVKHILKPKSLNSFLAVFEGMITLHQLAILKESEVEAYKSALIKLLTQINSKLHNPVTSTKVTQLTALIKTQPRGEINLRVEQLRELRDVIARELLQA